MTRGAIRIFLMNFMKKDRKIYGLFKILLTKGGKNATLENIYNYSQNTGFTNSNG